jgi:hypothetical protein
MTRSVESEETNSERSTEIGSQDAGGSGSERIATFRKPNSGQSVQFVAESASSSRARRDGGPRTRLGKGKSNRNAITHGIFAKARFFHHDVARSPRFADHALRRKRPPKVGRKSWLAISRDLRKSRRMVGALGQLGGLLGGKKKKP